MDAAAGDGRSPEHQPSDAEDHQPGILPVTDAWWLRTMN